MSTKVRNIGYPSPQPRWGVRGTFTTSDNQAIVVSHDYNAAAAYPGYGDLSGVAKFTIDKSANRSTWSQLASVTPAVPGRVTANLDLSNNIGLIIMGTDRTMRYCRVTAAGAAGAWETVHAANPAGENEAWSDLSFSDAGVPSVALIRTVASGTARQRCLIYTRRTSDNTWISSGDFLGTVSSSPKSADLTVSYLVLKGGSATSRNIVVAVGRGTLTADQGVQIWTGKLNESTGVVSSMTLRSTVAVGEVPGNSTSGASREAMLFASATSEYTLGIQHWEKDRRLYIARGTWDGTTWTQTVSPSTFTPNAVAMVDYNMTMTYGNDVLNFVRIRNGNVFNWHAKIDRNTGAVRWSPIFRFDNMFTTPNYSPIGGTGPHTQFSSHDVAFLFMRNGNGIRNEVFHHYAVPTRAPAAVTPAPAATVTSSTPPLSARGDIDKQYPQSHIKIVWQFASDSTFTTNVRTYTQADTKVQSIVNTHLAGSFVLFTDVLPAAFALTQGIWYVRAAHIDTFGNQGSWTTTQSFTVSHKPSASNLRPSGGMIFSWTGIVTASWVFTDPSSTDSQTAFQILVEQVSDGVVVYDSGKVASTAKTHDMVIPLAQKDIALRWKIRLWDIDDVAGDYSSGALFYTADGPGVSVNLTNGQVLTTAIPTITGTVSVGGTRRVKYYQIVIRNQDGTVAHNSGIKAINLGTSETFNYTVPGSILRNGRTYTISTQITDDLGLQSAITPITVTTAWNLPATITVAPTVETDWFNTEGYGFVKVKWNDENRDAQFIAWRIYRKADLIDPTTFVVLEAGEWEVVGDFITAASNYEYNDYYAPSGYQVTYAVYQVVNRFGDEVESASSPVTPVVPISNSYWVLEPDQNNAFQLANVTSDSYNEDYEEEEFFVIGRGRHVDQGDRLGYKGSLTAQIRDAQGVSARQRKIRLEQLKRQNRNLYLRTPFGDFFKVAIGNMEISRVAGVGLSEFVDITIPYTEVGE